ncbi:MAG: serine/threonine protein kinase [Planctomycetes bacterium]|nr:serine/threonine protein kinase [Planctomycetota bacterium]
MKPSTADELAHRLEQLDLVQPVHLDAVWGDLGGRNVPVADLGAALVRRELLTGYQLDRLLRGEEQGFFYGRAKILYQIGAGSFSRVYRAIHADTGRILAVKVLRSRHSSDPDKCKSFQREAEMGRLLRHPNIVAIEDVGMEHNSSYITMEFVEGQTLRELVRVRGAIDLPRAAGLILQLVVGLDYAHRLGITHRDLKASNVLISFTGEAKLVDFGLAGGDTTGSKTLRRMGQPRTVDYATLENLGGVKDDCVRSDIYFLGTIAYLALCGVSALTESRDRAVRTDPRRFTGVEPLGFRMPDMPRDIVEVISRMVQIDPHERWQTMMEVRRALEPLVAKHHAGGTAAAASTAAHAVARRVSRVAAKVAPSTATQAAVKGTLMLAEASSQEQGELRSFFKQLGFRVLLTENLERALVRCSTTPRAADCLLISASSFGEAGVEVFNTLSQDPFLRKVPAILLVDPTQHELIDLAKIDDLRRVVATPLQPAEVAKILTELLAGSE